MQISTHHAEARQPRQSGLATENGDGWDYKGGARGGGEEVGGIILGVWDRGQVVSDKIAMLIFQKVCF